MLGWIRKIWDSPILLNVFSIGFLLIVMSLFVSTGIHWLAQRPYFAIKNIRVESETTQPLKHVNALTLRTAVSPLKGNFLTIQLESLRQAIEQVPWVYTASIRRQWPNRLIVIIREHEVLGSWEQNGLFLSRAGVLFSANSAEVEEEGILAQFSGPSGSEQEIAQRFLQLQQQLSPLKRYPTAINVSARHAWNIELDNKTMLYIGQVDNPNILDQRIAHFFMVYPQIQNHWPNQTFKTIDLRYPNGLAVQLAPTKEATLTTEIAETVLSKT